MWRRTFACLIAGGSVGAAQVADGNTGSGSSGGGSVHPARPVSFEDLKRYLSLSDSQLRELLKLADEQTAASQGNSQSVEEKRFELDALLRAGSRDLLRLGQLTLDIYTLTNQPPAAASVWRERALAVLTPQQRARLEPLEQAGRLLAPATQAVALNLVAAPPPPAPPLSPMPLLP